MDSTGTTSWIVGRMSLSEYMLEFEDGDIECQSIPMTPMANPDMFFDLESESLETLKI